MSEGMKELFDISAISDKGRVRQKNEDYYGIFEPETEDLMKERGVLAIVSDGMGGHFSGGDASRLTVEVMSEAYFEENDRDPARILEEALCKANREVFHQVGEGRNGLAGTTCTAVVFFPDRLIIAHAGDSRAYLLREGEMEQLTHDHSVVGEMYRQGMLDEEEARTHPRRNVITKAIGLREEVVPDIMHSEKFVRGDAVLICSDGLFSMLREKEIGEIAMSVDPEKACQRLVDRANEEGGADNENDEGEESGKEASG